MCRGKHNDAKLFVVREVVQPRVHGGPGRGGNRKSHTIWGLPRGFERSRQPIWTFPLHMAVENIYIDAGKCAGRVFCGRYCCGQRRARCVRVDQGIPDGKELPKAIEVEKPLLSTVPAFVVRPELQKGTIMGFPREGSLALARSWSGRMVHVILVFQSG